MGRDRDISVSKHLNTHAESELGLPTCVSVPGTALHSTSGVARGANAPPHICVVPLLQQQKTVTGGVDCSLPFCAE